MSASPLPSPVSDDTPRAAISAGGQAVPRAAGGRAVSRLRVHAAAALLWAALGLILGGVTLPAFSVSSFWVFERSYSILGGIVSMAESGQTALAVFVFTVSVLFPVGKIVLGLAAVRQMRAPGARLPRTLPRTLRWLAALSRWSMADVLVLALLVILLNGQLLTTADVHSGIALFALGVIASALGLGLIERAK